VGSRGVRKRQQTKPKKGHAACLPLRMQVYDILRKRLLMRALQGQHCKTSMSTKGAKKEGPPPSSRVGNCVAAGRGGAGRGGGGVNRIFPLPAEPRR
jgi:hypothetical protein